VISLIAGLGLGLSLIVAIGAQNVFVLRQGIRRDHVFAVVVVCALSDALLIAAGVAGLGYLLESAPWLVTAARWLGAAFLLAYAALAARRAWRGGDALTLDRTQQDSPSTTTVDARWATRTPTRLAPVLATALALTWLNPHVYLDTVLMLGSIAATHGEQRWSFALGAILASCLWFVGLGYGARHLGRWLNTARAWRILDAVIAAVMLAIAVSLVLPVIAG
jgi:L-lysine exporter family protein LysE/ArgO